MWWICFAGQDQLSGTPCMSRLWWQSARARSGFPASHQSLYIGNCPHCESFRPTPARRPQQSCRWSRQLFQSCLDGFVEERGEGMPKFSAPRMWVGSSNEGLKHLPFQRAAAPTIRSMGSSHYYFLPGFHTWSTNSLDSQDCMSRSSCSLHLLRSRRSSRCSSLTYTSLQRWDQQESEWGFLGSQKSTADRFRCLPVLPGSRVGQAELRTSHIIKLDLIRSLNTSTDLCPQWRFRVFNVLEENRRVFNLLEENRLDKVNEAVPIRRIKCRV